MVHALNEIRRVLAPDGILIDLRPLAGSWPIEVESSRETKEAGHVSDLPEGLQDDRAANASIAKAAEQKWFIREREEFFPFFYYWDSPNEMKEYIDEQWVDFITVDEDAWKNIRSMWAVADADARLRVRVKMMITRWKKVK
jgi:SAM-dependent methyltransferase